MKKARSPILEYNIVEHCNLSCKGCSHLSPHFPATHISLTEAEKDLTKLSEILHVGEIKLMGGEPLLHPHLTELIELIDQLNIADTITIVTNGTLVVSAPETIWPLVDRLRISIYPRIRLPMDKIKTLVLKHDMTLLLQKTDNFHHSFYPNKHNDPELTEKIFKSCALPSYFNCHTLRQGKYYKCTPAAYIPEFFGKNESSDFFQHDNYDIHQVGANSSGLQEYLDRRSSMSACQYCLGTAGKKFPHELSKGEQLTSCRKIEEVLDHTYLETHQDMHLAQMSDQDFMEFFEKYFEVWRG